MRRPAISARRPVAPVTTPARLTAVPALFTALLALVLAGAGPAHAAGYRYWSFWEGDGRAWAYATQGPALARPADGAVNGYRFAVSADSQDAAKPREAPDFAAVCGSTPERSGSKRVAVVVDAGTAADAPEGETPPAPRAACARVDTDATSADALAAVAKPLRYNGDALLCGITGYPASGCGEQVADTGAASPTPSPSITGASRKSEETDGAPSAGVLTGAAAVLALAVAATWQARRRRA
ncbi:SCO2322 family protein [Streptomyces sp. NBC_01498]|uniref:SCO2322 family protein n=1 Tax=Streptomyces sp. NBC_01498 TaxID=2975870 RepID=UPI002E7B8C0B|nr:SCO2322 family protein [Streptomyces sp. NBC_01498]WTL27124.1 SCO2322 family protein [Streptomyces sp. NBC_01498]